MQVPVDLLGYRGDPKWRDMSDYLVHFTSEANLLSILQDRQIRPLTHGGWAMNDAETSHLRMSACFSEIPIDMIDRLTARRGQFGIGFRREFLRSKGAGRLWYAEEPQRSLIFAAFQNIWRSDPTRRNPLWRLVPFFDSVTPGHDFTWEREWRVPGGVSFELNDIQFLIVPRGTDVTVFQNPAQGVPLLSAESMEFWTEAFSALGGPQDQYVDEFLKTFGNPNEYLSWDSEDQDYLWTVAKWGTHDAIGECFTELDNDAEMSLFKRLEGISSGWVLLSELRGLRE